MEAILTFLTIVHMLLHEICTALCTGSAKINSRIKRRIKSEIVRMIRFPDIFPQPPWADIPRLELPP